MKGWCTSNLEQHNCCAHVCARFCWPLGPWRIEGYTPFVVTCKQMKDASVLEIGTSLLDTLFPSAW